MPGVTGYAHDIFVSYAHADNEPLEKRAPWVTRFVADLEISLRQRLGASPAIYFDVRKLSSSDELAHFLNHARNAAIFIAILSPSYVMREWTRDELKAFLENKDSFTRLCPVEILPLDSDADYPKEFTQVKRASFWHCPGDARTPMTIQPDLHTDKYCERIHDLAFELRQRLKHLGVERRAAAPASAAIAPPTDKSKTVLLAQVTDDLEEDRSNVRRHLEQFGLAVLPSTTYPQGGADFRAAFAADCSRARLFVQMLGPLPSRRPPDLEASYAQTQYALAGQCGVERMLWRRPDLKLDAITHRDAPLLVAPETEAVGLEAFKAGVVRKLTAPPPAPREQAGIGGGFVFINASQTDLPLAQSIYYEMTRHRCSAALPFFDGTSEEIRLDLQDSLIDCSALVLVYGSVTPVWVRGQLRLFDKLRPRRERPPHVLAVFAGPPEEKPELVFTMPDVRFIDARKDGSVAKVIDMVRDLIQ